jgi:putative hydrolase of the HAD superfamily
MISRIREELLAPKRHRPCAEAEEVLRLLLRRGCSLHVLSNHTDYLPFILRKLGWLDLFARVTFSQGVGAQKPDPRLSELAVRRARCALYEVAHVGDQREADYQGARRAGLRAIWLNRAGSVSP